MPMKIIMKKPMEKNEKSVEKMEEENENEDGGRTGGGGGGVEEQQQQQQEEEEEKKTTTTVDVRDLLLLLLPGPEPGPGFRGLPSSNSTSKSTSTSKSGDLDSVAIAISAIDVLNHLLQTKVLCVQQIQQAVQAVQAVQQAQAQAQAQAQQQNTKKNKRQKTDSTATATATATAEATVNATPAAASCQESHSHTHVPTPTPKHSQSQSHRCTYRYRHIALQFYYDGSKYNGLAENVGSPQDNSVEKQLFNALKKANLLETTVRSGSGYSRCGRTDKGVSSAGQVVALKLKSAFPLTATYDQQGLKQVQDDELPSNEVDAVDVWTSPRTTGRDRDRDEKSSSSSKEQPRPESVRLYKRQLKEYPYTKMLNNLLPPDIRILGWTPCTEEFNARFSCTSRTYRYFFCSRNLNLTKMRHAIKMLQGTHDFRNFCKMDVLQVSNFTRTIHKANIVVMDDDDDDKTTTKIPAQQPIAQSGTTTTTTVATNDQTQTNQQQQPQDNGKDQDRRICYFEIHGQAFLWHQIRCIVQVLFYVGMGLEPPTIVQQLLDVQTNPAKPSYPYAPEQPLVLHSCGYNVLRFQYSASNLWNVTTQLEQQWEELIINAARIRNCIDSLKHYPVRTNDLIEFCQKSKKKMFGSSSNSGHGGSSIVQSQKFQSFVADLASLFDKSSEQQLDEIRLNSNNSSNEEHDDGTMMTRTIEWHDALRCIQKHFGVVPDPQHSLTDKSSGQHIPVMQRSRSTTYEEKVAALHSNKRRRSKYEENIIHKKQPDDVDKEFYQRKQQQGSTSRE